MKTIWITVIAVVVVIAFLVWWDVYDCAVPWGKPTPSKKKTSMVNQWTPEQKDSLISLIPRLVKHDKYLYYERDHEVDSLLKDLQKQINGLKKSTGSSTTSKTVVIKGKNYDADIKAIKKEIECIKANL